MENFKKLTREPNINNSWPKEIKSQGGEQQKSTINLNPINNNNTNNIDDSPTTEVLAWF